jgi:sensor domain CHASE-containing protein
VRRKKAPGKSHTVPIAIGAGITIVAIVVAINYYLDQTSISGQRFGDQLSQIQSDLKNETLSFDTQLTQYKNGQIPKDQMLKITDEHILTMKNILPKYDQLKAPESFVPSLQLFKLSTETQIESDSALREWILTGDNATRAKSDQLLQQSFQYEMNALQSYESSKSKGSQ